MSDPYESPATITSFRGTHDFLSNFYQDTPLRPWPDLPGVTYATGEHLFQALKAVSREGHMLVSLASTPGDAKQLGRKIARRPDWDEVRLAAMRFVLRVKFDTNRSEAYQLLLTERALLIEGNTWNDRTWGMVRDTDGSWHGENWLGILLMARRAELQAHQWGAPDTPADVRRWHL